MFTEQEAAWLGGAMYEGKASQEDPDKAQGFTHTSSQLSQFKSFVKHVRASGSHKKGLALVDFGGGTAELAEFYRHRWCNPSSALPPLHAYTLVDPVLEFQQKAAHRLEGLEVPSWSVMDKLPTPTPRLDRKVTHVVALSVFSWWTGPEHALKTVIERWLKQIDDQFCNADISMTFCSAHADWYDGYQVPLSLDWAADQARRVSETYWIDHTEAPHLSTLHIQRQESGFRQAEGYSSWD